MRKKSENMEDGARSRKRNIRYLVLLLILLAIVVHDLYIREKVTGWNNILVITVFPINGDGSKIAEDYINSLGEVNVREIALFINKQAKEYKVSESEVIDINVAQEVFSKPPQLSKERSLLGNIYWSIAFRVWVNWQLIFSKGGKTDIAIYVMYFDPSEHPRLSHSVGLQRGLMGLVYAYADREYQGSNNVILTHEVMHTLGAIDKYDLASNNPIFPVGYADPTKFPLYPQEKAEIMGGRIPLSADMSAIPRDLNSVVVGQATAAEIHWLSK